jgi:hypothetical protein
VQLCEQLLGRGLDFFLPRLYILDGGKALSAAVRKHAGLSDRAFIGSDLGCMADP